MKFRKVLSFLLAGVLLTGLLPIGVLAAPEDGNPAEPAHRDLSSVADGATWRSPEGVEYIVLKSSAKMVSAVKTNANGNYILGANIDMGGVVYNFPIFGNTVFSGIFDGNGYAILNFTVDSSVNANHGLIFHSITGSPKILNLTVGSPDSHIPAIFREGHGESIGGIVGAMKGTDSRTLLSGNTVYADITYDSVRSNTVMIGGMIGKAGPCTIQKCNFYGSVVFTANSAIKGKNTMVGGMVGRHNLSEGLLIIRNCNNYADIDISARTMGGGVRECAGGMIGTAEYPIEVTGCTNAGTMISDHRSGGIVGDIKPAKNAGQTFVVSNCVNSGVIRVLINADNAGNAVSDSIDVAGAVGAGGIIGGVRTGEANTNLADYAVTVTKCANTGAVSTEYADEALRSDSTLTAENGILSKGKCAAGGIIGRAFFGYYTVENCYSVADISTIGKYGSAAATAAGIIGYLYINNDAVRFSSVRNCFAIGELRCRASTQECFGICVVSSNKASAGYLPEIIDCCFCLTANGKTVTSAVNMAVTGSSGGIESKTMEQFASGDVATLLGDAFEQAAESPYPTLVHDQEELPEIPERVNLFSDPFVGGYYNEKGQFRADASYKTVNMLAFAPGTVLTFGALRKDQPSLGHLFDSAKKSIGRLTEDQLTVVADLGNGYFIYSYTVPETVSYICVTAPARRAYLTLLTKNDPFDADGYYDYFGIHPMNGNADSPLWQKRALYAGDSISYGYSDNAVNGVVRAWAGRIAYHYDMDYVNVSVSGATVTNLTQNQVLPQLTPYLGQEFDYVVLEGGVNDANTSYCNAPVGIVSDSVKPGSFDASTYAGALEELFCTVRTAFPEALVGFVITYRMPRVPNIYSNYHNYLEVTKQICEKWGVDCLNLYEDDVVNQEILATSTDSYLKDGVHPNASGYEHLTPIIASFMEGLTAHPMPGDPSSGEHGEETGEIPGELPTAETPTEETPTEGTPTGGVPEVTEPAPGSGDPEPSGSQPGTTPVSDDPAGCRSVLARSLLIVLLICGSLPMLFRKSCGKNSAFSK